MEGFGNGEAREPIRALWARKLALAQDALKRGGPLRLILSVFRLYVLDYRSFYLYRRRHRAWPEDSFRPRLDGFEEYFVTSNEQAETLARNHADFRSRTCSANLALARGAVAFCIYVGRDVAHVAWFAATPAGRRALDRLGFEVRFDEGEAWTGAAWTAPHYRGRGLLTYGNFRRFEHLRHMGVMVSRGAVETSNVASVRANEPFNPGVYAIGHQWRVFCWRRWSERTVATGDGERNAV